MREIWQAGDFVCDFNDLAIVADVRYTENRPIKTDSCSFFEPNNNGLRYNLVQRCVISSVYGLLCRC